MRQFWNDDSGSILPVFAFIAGLFVLGFLYYILNEVVTVFTTLDATGSVHSFMLFIWSAILIVYLVFGGWYTVRLYNERNYPGGMM